MHRRSALGRKRPICSWARCAGSGPALIGAGTPNLSTLRTVRHLPDRRNAEAALSVAGKVAKPASPRAVTLRDSGGYEAAARQGLPLQRAQYGGMLRPNALAALPIASSSRSANRQSLLQCCFTGGKTGGVRMFDGVSYVDPNHDPIIHEGEDSATVIVMNAGPCTVELRTWTQPRGEGEPLVHV